jgi:hypothetical protein
MAAANSGMVIQLNSEGIPGRCLADMAEPRIAVMVVAAASAHSSRDRRLRPIGRR